MNDTPLVAKKKGLTVVKNQSTPWKCYQCNMFPYEVEWTLYCPNSKKMGIPSDIVKATWLKAYNIITRHKKCEDVISKSLNQKS